MEPVAWPYPIVRLKPGKEALLSKGHPWVYSGALAEPATAPVVRISLLPGTTGVAVEALVQALRRILKRDH